MCHNKPLGFLSCFSTPFSFPIRKPFGTSEVNIITYLHLQTTHKFRIKATKDSQIKIEDCTKVAYMNKNAIISTGINHSKVRIYVLKVPEFYLENHIQWKNFPNRIYSKLNIIPQLLLFQAHCSFLRSIIRLCVCTLFWRNCRVPIIKPWIRP